MRGEWFVLPVLLGDDDTIPVSNEEANAWGLYFHDPDWQADPDGALGGSTMWHADFDSAPLAHKVADLLNREGVRP